MEKNGNKGGITMRDETKGIIFLAAIPFVVTFFTIIAVVYVKNLPDPLNAIAILSLSFGPLSLMLWYWTSRFYFKREKGLRQI